MIRGTRENAGYMDDFEELRRELRECPDCEVVAVDDLSGDGFSPATWLGACETHRERLVDEAG